jgi:signal transduction histidine kinase
VPRIVQLSQQVVAGIAAGELVERPASVLEEMLENGIDAGGTRIDVEVGQGGLDGIRVVNDGCGIDAHATSKLRSADDLAAIGTLGFRGGAGVHRRGRLGVPPVAPGGCGPGRRGPLRRRRLLRVTPLQQRALVGGEISCADV